MSGPAFDLALATAVTGAAALMTARRSLRAGLALLVLYALQAACLAWASRTIDDAPWSGGARLTFLAAMLLVLGHRLATYVFPRPPAPRDRLLTPLVHVAQAWLFLELAAWPVRRLVFPASASIDAWALGAPAAFAVLALAWTHRRPVTTRQRVAVPALRSPLRVVQLSDLHLGPYLPDSRLAWLADRVSAERADLIALTGDFLTLRTLHDWAPVLRFAEKLHAPQGVVACLGNHDVPVADGLTATLQSCGVTVLRDEVVWLRRGSRTRTAVAGLDWRAGHGARDGYAAAFARVCREAGPDGPAVVLCHQPAVFDLAPPAFGGIMLAGHLHGGQVGLRWGAQGGSLLRLFGLYDQGLFARGRRRLYSHRGTGVYGFPLRIGVPAEIAVLDLVPDVAAAPAPAPFAEAAAGAARAW